MTFVLAHSVNAFVAYLIETPAYEPIMQSTPSKASVHSADPNVLAKGILLGGLFAVAPHQQLFEAGGGGTTTAPPPPLNVSQKLSLIGIVQKTSAGGLVIVEELSSKKQTLFHLEDTVPEIGMIAEIQKDKVLFRRGAQEEWLHLELAKLTVPALPPKPATAMSVRARRLGDVRTVDRRELRQAIEDLPRLFQHAQPVPEFIGNRLDGFRLEQVNFYGFFGRLGLQTDDVLKRINGVEIRDPSMLVAGLQHMKDERSVTIDFLRDGTPLTFSYEIR
ncbi:general secretion pathway protein GspC [Nitrospira sp. KM1]|nr:general secretion pathway protein GspC [Nitrospira sp. KM1]